MGKLLNAQGQPLPNADEKAKIAELADIMPKVLELLKTESADLRLMTDISLNLFLQGLQQVPAANEQQFVQSFLDAVIPSVNAVLKQKRAFELEMKKALDAGKLM